MQQDELAITFYNSARAEIVQRLVLREQMVLASLSTTSIIAGFAFRSGANITESLPILHIIPLLCFTFGIAVLRHNWIIRSIGRYIHTQLAEPLDQLKANTVEASTIHDHKERIMHWDTYLGVENRKRLKRFRLVEVTVQIILLYGPAALTSAYLWCYRIGSRAFAGIELGATVLAVVSFIIFYSGKRKAGVSPREAAAMDHRT